MDRKPRFKKNPNADKVVYAVTRDKLDILEAIYEMEYARSNVLYSLLPHRHYRGFTHSLAIIHQAGLADKVVTENTSVFNHDIYTLTDKGEKLLMQHRDPEFFVRTYRPRGTGLRREHTHTMMISDTIGNLRAGAVEHDCRIIPQSEIERKIGKTDETPLSLSTSISHVIKGQVHHWTGHFDPDAVFGIEYPDATASYFALEEQNAGDIRVNTLKGRASMLRKLLAYHKACSEKQHKTAWGVPNLRVIFRFNDMEKCKASIKLAEELFGSTNLFLFGYIPSHRETKTGLMLEPDLFPKIMTGKWQRAGMEPLALYQ